MPFRPVLPCGVHRLEDHQERVAVVGVEDVLEFAEFFGVPGEELFVVVLGGVEGFDRCRPFFEGDILLWRYKERRNFHDSGSVIHRGQPLPAIYATSSWTRVPLFAGDCPFNEAAEVS